MAEALPLAGQGLGKAAEEVSQLAKSAHRLDKTSRRQYHNLSRLGKRRRSLQKGLDMSGKPYAEVISDTDVMISGIRKNQSVLARRQIDLPFADGLKADVDACIALNNEQEALKAKLKEKTAELDGAMSALHKKTAEARTIIKLDMPQAAWREFGIEDKR